MTLAEKIQTLRKEKGLSQDQLALELGVSRQSVSKWELGDSMPDINKILQLSDYFQVSTDYLLREELEQPSAQSDSAQKSPAEYSHPYTAAGDSADTDSIRKKRLSPLAKLFWGLVGIIVGIPLLILLYAHLSGNPLGRLGTTELLLIFMVLLLGLVPFLLVIAIIMAVMRYRKK